jgi:hypothetical protein
MTMEPGRCAGRDEEAGRLQIGRVDDESDEDRGG